MKAWQAIKLIHSMVLISKLGVDMQHEYMNLVYSNEGDVFNSIQQSYPSQFDSYMTLFQNLNYNDVCANYYGPFDPVNINGILK